MESAELRSIGAFSAMVSDVLEDATIRLADESSAQPPAPVDFAEIAVYSFRQTWPDGSCGFGGIAVQVLTDAQTMVIYRASSDLAAVYMPCFLARPVG